MPRDISRTTMTEVEMLARWIEYIRKAEETARGLAVSRKDMRWITVARLLSEINEKAQRIATTAPPRTN